MQKTNQYLPEFSKATLGIIIRGRKKDREREGENLKGKNKNQSRIDPAKKQGIYKYVCPKCGKVYIGQTRRCCETRWREHQRAIEKGDWTHSGISQHHQNCDEPFDVSNFQVIKTKALRVWP